MSAAHSNPASISIKKVERKEKRTIYNTGHLGPSLDTTKCGSPPYSTSNQLESIISVSLLCTYVTVEEGHTVE